MLLIANTWSLYTGGKLLPARHLTARRRRFQQDVIDFADVFPLAHALSSTRLPGYVHTALPDGAVRALAPLHVRVTLVAVDEVFEASLRGGVLTVSVHSHTTASRRRAISLPDVRSAPVCRQ